MSKTNLCIVGLSKLLTDDVCKQLSEKMDLFYANIEEIFAYDLMDVGKIEELCGIDYLFKEQKSIIRRVCGYENTLVNIDYTLLNNQEILDIVSNQCLIIYLGLTSDRYIYEQKKEMISNNLISINIEVFEDRDYLCRQISDINIECDKMQIEDICKNVLEKVLEYYS